MGIESQTTGYGPPAIELLGEQIARLKSDDRLTPATVVVESHFVAVAVRRALAVQTGGVANIDITTLRALGQSLGAAGLTRAGLRPASIPLTASAIRAALVDSPGIFAPVADHPATAQALTAAYRELRTVPDSAVSAVASCSARSADVVRICQDARSRLSTGWYDDDDLLSAATEELRQNPHPDIGPVIVHLLPTLTAPQVDFLRALATRGSVLVNIGVTGNSDADAPVIAAYARAGITTSMPDGLEQPVASRIISASDPDDEVRAVVRNVVQWAQDGVRLGRIAVLYGSADPYARLVQAQLAAAGIGVTGVPVRTLGDTLFGRTLQALLALPDRGFRRPDVLAVLTDAPILDDGRSVPDRAWERLSRDAGVVGGEDWSQRLALLADSHRRRADQAATEGNLFRADHRRRDADRAEALAAFVDRLRNDLARGAEVRTWAGLAAWAAALMRTYLGEESRRDTWPAAEQVAALRVEKILDQFAELDALGGPVPTLATFRLALDIELDTPARQIGQLGGGVLVGNISVAPGLTFDRLIVLGMAEGRFPSPHLEDSLLPDAERAAAEGHLQMRSDRVHDDHRTLLAALAGAHESVLTWPRGDLRRPNDQPASRWLLDSAGALSGIPGIRSEDLLRLRDRSWFDSIASFADGLARTTVFATDQELRLAAVARGELDHPVLTDDPTLATALAVMDHRASSDFTRFDGNLTTAGAEIRELTELQRFSATQLQTWATCPRAYLFTYLLGVEHVEEPERQLSINALDRGTLFHAILEQFVQEAIDGDRPPTSPSQTDRDRLHEIAHRHFEQFRRQGRTGRERLWRRDQSAILAELDRTLDLNNTRLASGFRPVAVEQRFDLIEAPALGDRTLHVRGSIDRIDRGPDGALEIIDYKTGKHDDYTALTEQNPHDGGKRLQLYIYALAGRDQFPDAPSVSAYYCSGAFRLSSTG